MFTNRKIPAFQKKIADLADVPALTAAELKARFDACPEELRQALNGVCDDGAALEARMDEYRAQTFAGEITREMLDAAVQAELTAKADQTALDAETAARESAQSTLEQRVSNVSSTASRKCQVYTGEYIGDGTYDRQYSLPARAEAVIVMPCSNNGPYIVTQGNTFGFGSNTPILTLSGSTMICESDRANSEGTRYFYIAFA